MPVNAKGAAKVLQILNDLLSRDSEDVLTDIFTTKAAVTDANKKLLAYPALQVGKLDVPFRADYELGPMGIINALLGSYDEGDLKGFGAICYITNDSGVIIKFDLTVNQVPACTQTRNLLDQSDIQA